MSALMAYDCRAYVGDQRIQWTRFGRSTEAALGEFILALRQEFPAATATGYIVENHYDQCTEPLCQICILTLPLDAR